MTRSFSPSDFPIESAQPTATSESRAALVVPDAHLLFSGDFKRSGSNLILTGQDGEHFAILDYFRHKKLPNLVTPDGAALSAKIIETLTGSGSSYQYAQATTPAPSAQIIGKVEKITGSATAIRNGVAVTLNVGDTLNKSDVIQTGSGSTLGISLLDGTTLNLSANSRMALSEFIFDANATGGNGSHLTLVQGAFAFVSGLVASTGGLNIETPVANIGIRGTVGVAVCSTDGRCQFTAGNEVAGPNAGQASTFELQAGGTYQDGRYTNGRTIGTVTVGSTLQVSPTGQVTSVPATIADPILAPLMQEVIQLYPQVTVPGPPAPQQAPQPGQPPGSNPQGGNSGSTTPPQLLTPPPPPPLQQNDQPQDFHPLAAIQAPTQTLVAALPASQTTPEVIVTVSVASPSVAVPHPIFSQSANEDADWQFTVPANTFNTANGAHVTLAASMADGSPLPNWINFNAATATFNGTPPPDANGSLQLKVVATDGESSVENFFTLNVNSVNDAPVVVNGANMSLATINENSANPGGATLAALLTGHFSDAADEVPQGSHANALAGLAIYSNPANPAGVWEWSTDGTTWHPIATDLSDSNALVLEASTSIRFVPSPGFHGGAPALLGRLIDDSAGPVTNDTVVDLAASGVGESTPYSAVSVVIDEVVNAPPVIQNVGGTVTVGEDNSVLLQALLAQVTDAENDQLTMTVSVAHGSLTSSQAILDAIANNSLTGIDTDGSDGTLTIAGSAAAITAAIQAGITYTPSGNVNSPDALDVAIADGQATATASVAINITSVNDAPVGSDNTVTTLEDTARMLAAIDFGFGDPHDSPANTLQAITITTLPAAGTLTDNGTPVTAGQSVSVADINAGLLTFTPGPNANGSGYASFTFQVQDDGGTANGGVDFDPTPNTIIINVSPVDDAAVAITAIATDSGTSGDFITNDTTLVVSGTNGALGTGEKVQISSDGSNWFDVTQTTGTTWSFDDTGTPHPSNVTYQVRVIDAAANVGSTASQLVVIDTAPPAAGTLSFANLTDTGTLNTPPVTQDATFDLSLAAQEPGSSVVFQVALNGGGFTNTPATQSALADGSYQFRALVTDAAGNTSTSNTIAVVVDNSAPTAVATVTGLSADTGAPGDFITSVASQAVSGSYTGTLLAGEKIQVSVDGATWIDATAASGSWSASGVTLVAGTGTLSARTIDAANNITTGTGHSYTLQTTGPAAVATVTGLSADTGAPGDFITSVASQAVSGSYTGTLLAGEKIQVSVDGATWIDATAASGSWSASGVTLVAGTGTLSVRTIDAANNITAGTGHSYTLDQTAPPAAVAITAIATDSGTSGDFITNDTTLVVSGTNGALGTGEKVQISSDGSNWFDVTQTTGTTWNFDDTGTPHPSNVTYQVRVIDAAANVGSTASQLVVIDTAPPAAGTLSFANLTDTGTLNTPPVTQDATFDLSLAAQEPGSSVVFQVALNGGGFTNTPATQSALADGSYQFRALVTDAAGNTSTSNTIAVVVDNSAPAAVATVTGLSADTGAPGDFITSVASQAVSGSYTGTLLAGEKIQVSVDGATWIDATAASGSWSASGVTLVAGTGTLSARTIDAANNITAGTGHSYTLQTTGPAAVATVTGLSADTGAPGDFITSVASQAVSGSYTGTLLAGEKIQVSVDGATWIDATAASGSWSASGVTLVAGTGTLSVRTIDAANNITAGTGHSYTLDQTAPPAAVAITAIATDSGTSGDFITNDTTLVVSGTNGALGTGEKVQISSDGSNWFDVTQTTGTTWNFDDTGTPHPSNVTYQVRVIDAAANVGSTASQLVVIDTAPPAAGTLSFANLTDTGTLNTPPVTQDATFDLSLAAQEPGSSVVFQVALNGGGFTNTPATQSALADGSYQFRALVTDAAGNTSTSNTIAVVVDNSAPTAVATVTGLSADTGAPGDFITSVASQAVSGSYTGTLLAGEKIQVSVDGATWIDATAASGSWSASGVTLVAGTGTLSARTIDAANNITTGTGHSYTLQTTGPAAVATVTGLSADTGAPGDFITSVASQAVSGSYTGTLLAGEKIQVSVDGATWIDATAASGSWSASGVTLVAGTGTLSVRTIDAANNITAGTGHSYTLDQTAPPAAVAITAIATDSGTSGDFITNDTTLVVSGTNGALGTGEKVQISSDGSNWFDVTQTTGTTWNFDDTGTPHPSNVTYQVRVIDAAANVGSTASQLVVIDTAPPAAGTLSFANLTDTGTLNTPPVTQDATFDLSLAAQEPGSSVVFQVALNGGGFTNTPATQSALADGSYQFRALVTDAAGNTSTSNTIAVVVDNSAPTAVATVTGLSADTGAPGDFITSVASQAVSGSYTGTLLAGEKIQVSVDGATWIDATAASGSWSASGVTLVAGTGTLSARTIDAANNITTGTGHSYTLQTTGPAAVATVTGLSADTGAPGDFITSVASQAVSGSYTGTLLAGEKIQVSVDGATWIDATAASGSWSASGVTLVAGTGTLSVRTIDAANNITAGTGHSYTLDQTAPAAAVAITAIATDSGTSGDFITNDTTLVVSGTNGALGTGEKVQISSDGSNWFDVTQTTGTTWNFDDTGTPHPSNVTYQVRVIDAAANVGSTASQLVVIDTAPPAAGTLSFANLTDTGTLNTPPVTQDATFDLSLAAQEPGSSVVFQVALNGGGFTNTPATQSALADGSYQFRALVTDAAGNTSTSNTIAVVVDNSAPAAAVAITAIATDSGTSGDFITNDTTLVVSGTNGALGTGEKVQISSDGSNWFDVTQTTGTTWNFDDTGTPHPSNVTYQVRVIDAAANVGSTASQLVVIDTAPPAAGTLSFANLTDTGTLNTPPVTQDATFDLSLAAQEPGSSVVFQVALNGGGFTNTPATQSALADGSYQFRALVTDAAGNASTSNIIAVTVDTTVPAAGTLSFANLQDTGTPNTPPVTQDTAFDLSLSGQEAGSSVAFQVSVNGGSFNPTTATQSGLGDGSYQFRALVTDAAGNASTSNIIAVTVDTTVPAAGTLSFANLQDTGTPNTPPVTQDTAFDLSLAGQEAGSSVAFQVSVNGGAFNPTTATQSGLGDGSYQFRALVTEAAGNASTSNIIAVTVDTTAPAAAVAITAIATDSGTAGDFITNDTTLVVSGTNGPLGAGEKVQISTDGGNWFDVAQTTGTTWSFDDTGNPHPSNVTYQVRVIDAAANVGNTASQLVIIDTVNHIVGDNNDNVLGGTAAVDLIEGLDGNDTLQGKAGDDGLDGGSGLDRAIYTDATGPISVDMALRTVSGPGVGSDTLVSIEQIRGSDFADTYVATGYTGVSPIGSVSANFNEFEGRAGDDTITGNGATQLAYLKATAGVTVNFTSWVAGQGASGTATGDASVGTDTFTGVQGVRGSEFDDTFHGSNNLTGVEVFQGRAGNDFIDGGGGFDRVLYGFRTDDNVTGGITITMAAGTVVGDASVGTDTLRSIEAARGTNFDDTYNAALFTINSSNGPNFGSAGSILIGSFQAALNEFEGLGGNDTITGNGNTRIDYINATAAVAVDLQAGTATGDASVGNDTFTGVNSVQGSYYNDHLFGSNNGSTIAESFDGGAGDDTIDGRGGFDQAYYNNAVGTGSGITVTVTTKDVLNDAFQVVGDASIGTDTLIRVESVRGTNFADTYNATGFNGASTDLPNGPTFNEFEGLGGNDIITGNGVTGLGATRISYVSATAGVTVDLAAGIASGDASVGTDTITGGVNRVRGSNFNDTIAGNANDNILEGQNGNDVLDGRGGNDTLTGGAGADTFFYSTGADIVTDFNHTQGDVINLLGSGVSSFAQLQPLMSQVNTNTLINFGGGNTMTLNNVTFTNLTAGDFAFTPISGDMGITVNSGGSVVLTTADLRAIDPNAASPLTFQVSTSTNGHVALASNPGATIPSFTEKDLEDGRVIFVQDVPNITQASFQVSVTDGPTTSAATIIATVPAAIIDVLTPNGYDFQENDPIVAMGGGQIQPAQTLTPPQITIVNAAPNVNLRFVFEGFGLTLDNNLNPTDIVGGTITTIHAFTNDPTPVPLFDLIGNVDAARWYDAVVATAAGDQTLFNALTDGWSLSFFGAAGVDAFGASDNNDYFHSSGGNDNFDGGFGFDRANYTSANGAIDVSLAAGTVTKYADSSRTAVASVDHLQSIEFVTGSIFKDIFNATGFSSSSINAGSTVTFNTGGTRNEFEGRGGDDLITGNGDTRISYLHATAGVTVTFSSWVPGLGASGTAVGNSSVGTDTFTGVNGVRGSFFDDVFNGSNNDPNTVEFFEGRGGNDLINGNGGLDRANYLFEDSGIVVHMAAGQVVGGLNTGTDILSSVESVIGTDFADTYDATGFSGSSTNAGSNGNFNEFEGAGGNDTITGNGNTRIAYYDATDGVAVTLGANGSGTSVGRTAANLQPYLQLHAPANFDPADVGADNIVSGVTRVRGSSFGDVITGNGADNILEGQAGNDTLGGGTGNDTLIGGTGTDRFVYTNGGLTTITDFDQSGGSFDHNEADRIDLRNVGIANFTALQPMLSASGNDTIITIGAGTITIKGVSVGQLQARDFLFAGQVDITDMSPNGFDFGALYDDFAGIDFLQSAHDATHYIAVNPGAGLLFTFSPPGGGVFSYDVSGNPTSGNVANIGIYDSSYDLLAVLHGYNFPLTNFLNAVASHDTNTLDAIFFNNAGIRYNAVGSSQVQDNDGHPGGDTFVASVNNDVFDGLTSFNGDGGGGDTVDYSHTPGLGPTGVNVDLTLQQATGLSGTDALFNIENLRGSAFDDTLTGDGSNNVLEGGPGDDALNGNGGIDTVSYEHASGGVTVDLASDTAHGTAPGDVAKVGTDTLSNFEAVRGSSFNDTLTGSGNSMLEGGAGADTLNGVNGGSDTASYEHATAAVTVNLLNPGLNTGDAAGDTFNFVRNLRGSQFNDTLVGDNNANVLNGWGTQGDAGDTLTGNGGADTFVFSGGHVTVTDFNHAENDKVDLSFLNFGTGISQTEIQSLIAAAPDSRTLDFGNGQSLTVVNVTVGSLQLGDFLGLHS